MLRPNKPAGEIFNIQTEREKQKTCVAIRVNVIIYKIYIDVYLI